MVLNLQIKSIIVSFLYGIIISYIIKLSYKYLFESKGILKIIVNVLFMFDVFAGYFLILRVISNSSFHIYFVFVLITGYILGYKLINKKTLH